MAVTDKGDFDENKSYTVAVPKEKVALKQHIAYSYPQWKLVDCDSIDDGANMVAKGKADCFIMGASQALIYDNDKNLKSVPLTKTMEACFAVKDGEATLLSVLNKTIKAMPSDMLTSEIAIYDSTSDTVSLYKLLKEHLAIVLAWAVSFIAIILLLFRKAKIAEANAKLAAENTQKLNVELKSALKSAEDASLAKTQFLQNMSHDIRTPMNAVLGYGKLMENELRNNEISKISEQLAKQQQSGNILLSIINNVLDMARIESGEMEVNEHYANIEMIRQRLFEMFANEAKKKNINLQYKINVVHTHVLTDVTKVEEIFVNILSNAMKYTPSKGSIIVKAEELPCDESGYMIIKTSVSDTGIGMSEDYLKTIFDSFTRERNTTTSGISGTGLGMAIVKKYVDLLGGTIDIQSEPGKGSTFIVMLKHKIADESYYLNRQEENVGTSHEILEGKNILLAEDNDLNAEIAIAILENAGLKVDRVENGIDCVNRIIEMPSGTYDMVLMDIQMPEMDGYTATQTIRKLPDKAKASIPIVAMTANAFEEDKRNALNAGMNGHIAKPIQIDVLFAILSKIVKQQEK
jgi:signal transduction histidine kinase/CheY-like chemotaxis protein